MPAKLAARWIGPPEIRDDVFWHGSREGKYRRASYLPRSSTSSAPLIGRYKTYADSACSITIALLRYASVPCLISADESSSPDGGQALSSGESTRVTWRAAKKVTEGAIH